MNELHEHSLPMSRRRALGVAAASTVTMTAMRPSAAATPSARSSPRACVQPFDIVDAQVHIGRGGIEPLIASMDALGIGAALLYEHWGMSPTGDPRHHPPGYLQSNGAWRAATTVAAQACIAHPGRFGCVVKVDNRDPELRAVLETLRSTPYVRGIRVLPVWTKSDAADFASGSHDQMFQIAEALQLPVFLFIPGRVEILHIYLRKFPRLIAIIDHIGMPFPNIPIDHSESISYDNLSYFDNVLDISSFYNVILKWSHPDRLPITCQPVMSAGSFLRRAIDAFGSERIIWASDHTMMRDSWLSLIENIRASEDLTYTEKKQILGQTANAVLNFSS